MKRGLKALANRFPDEKGTESTQTVTTVSPMKRGLKASVRLRLPSYNRFPDEKGTESGYDNQCQLQSPVQGVPVTTVSPMKRGLKATPPLAAGNSTSSYNRFPDEKGTESHIDV